MIKVSFPSTHFLNSAIIIDLKGICLKERLLYGYVVSLCINIYRKMLRYIEQAL